MGFWSWCGLLRVTSMFSFIIALDCCVLGLNLLFSLLWVLYSCCLCGYCFALYWLFIVCVFFPSWFVGWWVLLCVNHCFLGVMLLWVLLVWVSFGFLGSLCYCCLCGLMGCCGFVFDAKMLTRL